ncbi:MAG: ribosome silencing factor [Candidatus Aceula meridiana]|nr:ribosome silencing factor [Candidatus Aceula meridiana]
MAKQNSTPRKSSLAIAKKTISLIAELALDKKAEHLVVLDVRKLANFCDYFVICSGNSDRQVKAIADNIREGLQQEGRYIPRPQGLKDSKWVIVDGGDIVTHVFEKETREFYGLEHLWQAGKKINWE